MERERSPKYLSSQLISFSNIRLSRFCLKDPVGPDPPVNPLCARTTLFKVFLIDNSLYAAYDMQTINCTADYYKAFPNLKQTNSHILLCSISIGIRISINFNS